MPLMYLPIPERACGIEYNCLSRRETDAHWLPAHDGLRQTTQEGCWWAHKGWVGADSSGIFVGCVWKIDRSSEKKEIASILKKGLLFIFFEEAPLGTERIKKLQTRQMKYEEERNLSQRTLSVLSPDLRTSNFSAEKCNKEPLGMLMDSVYEVFLELV